MANQVSPFKSLLRVQMKQASKRSKCLCFNHYTLIALLRVPILRPNWQYKASTAKLA